MTINPIEKIQVYNKIKNSLNKFYQQPTDETTEELTTELYEYITANIHINDQLKERISHAFQMIIIDAEGYMTYIDTLFCQKLGYQKDELLQHHYRVLHAGVHNADFYKQIWETIKKGQTWIGDICTQSKTGEIFWFRTNIIPNIDPNGDYPSFSVFRTDISDVKYDDKHLVETLEDDYRKLFSQLMNLTFRVQQHKETEKYRFRLFEGKLAKKIINTTEQMNSEQLEDTFFHRNEANITTYFDQAFRGEEVIFKHHLKNLSLYTMLSPIYENDEVIEVVGSSIDITSLEKAEAQVKQLAYYDSLTKLPNRTKFREDLKQAVENGKDQPFAVLYCDIDRLKYINDTLGEGIGDQVIEIISKRIQSVLGKRGSVYRYGGDEFCLILRLTKQDVKRISDQILIEIKQPISTQGNEFFVTSSIGISYYGDDAWEDEELLNHASIAVHYCKMNGRNSRLFYTAKMNEMYHDILLLEADIRKALKREEFNLHYQPKLNVITGEVIGLEALIRWNHPVKGPISPATFIPIAEESGIITQIGEWVIREACQQHMTWVEEGFDPIRIAVNVSAIELQRFDFAKQVAQIIKETQMDPSYLEIEITENSIMENTEDCIQTMNTLRQMGISLSIDDFGTGYSSFGYLRKFPINYLKIDQSFVRSALIEPSSAEIVKAMIQLAHTFGLKVVAEGVEEKEILSLLQENHCDYYQGYYYSKPVPACELESVIYGKMA
ncbi:sensor domain-containing protein [Amphibacillus sp. Q70]|uniref:sensor domain-containing protein n=1 Tax=Amphibacillus sp. Q70 TaxID=3453416 RepID=UPI003F824B8C